MLEYYMYRKRQCEHEKVESKKGDFLFEKLIIKSIYIIKSITQSCLPCLLNINRFYTNNRQKHTRKLRKTLKIRNS
jgi:hypothetical protein